MAGAPYPFEPAPAAGQAPVRWRHPMNLPAGSVRALLILMVMGTIWTLLVIPNVQVPLYLYYLLFLTIGSYFAARNRAPAVPGVYEPPPLYLPRGTIRGLITLGFIGVLGFAIYKDPGGFFDRRLLTKDDRDHATLLLPVTIVGAFLLGVIVAWITQKTLAGPEGLPPWYQDVQAWVSVLAVLGLGAQVILETVVFPSMENPPNLPHVQLILSAIVAFYFGSRA